jgi:hypothetical protein
VYDFYDAFSTATSTGPDKSLGAAGSVGNVVRKSVYSAVGGVITYIADLPAVISGQRHNFWASLGIKDSAGISGETISSNHQWLRPFRHLFSLQPKLLGVEALGSHHGGCYFLGWEYCNFSIPHDRERCLGLDDVGIPSRLCFKY